MQDDNEKTNPLYDDEIKPPLSPLVMLTNEQVDNESSEIAEP